MGSDENDVNRSEDEEDDEPEEELPQPDEEDKKANEIDSDSRRRMAEHIRDVEHTILEIAQDFPTEVIEYRLSTETVTLDPTAFEEINQAVVRSINPEIYDIYSDVEDAAVLDLYETVAALNHFEAETGGDEGLEADEDTDTLTVGSRFEIKIYDFVAQHILNGQELFDDEIIDAANTLLESDSVIDKRKAFTDLIKKGDNNTRCIINLVTHIALTFLLITFMSRQKTE